MSEYKTAEIFPPYTQHSGGEFLKRVTCYYKIIKIISLHFLVQTDYFFLKSQEMFKMMPLCLQAGFKIR